MLPVGVAVVIAVVFAAILDHLVQGHGIFVVGFGAHADHRLVAQIGPPLAVERTGQPDSSVTPLVEQIPTAAFEPHARRAVGPGAQRLAVAIADVEASPLVPADAVVRGEPMGDVKTPLGEHPIQIAMLHDLHVLGPNLVEDRAVAVAGPPKPVR